MEELLKVIEEIGTAINFKQYNTIFDKVEESILKYQGDGVINKTETTKITSAINKQEDKLTFLQ